MKKSYSLKFVRLHTSGDEDAFIYVRIILDRKKTEFSTGIKGPECDWNRENQKFDERTQHNTYLNHQLDCVVDRILDMYRNMISCAVVPTAEKLRDQFRGKKDTITEQPELLDYIKYRITEIKSMGSYKQGTIAHYNIVHKLMTRFLKSINERHMLIGNLRRKHIENFKKYLLSTDSKELVDKPVCLATCNRYLSKLKAVLNEAIKNEIIQTNPFKGVTLERVKGNREYLTKDELKLIEQADLKGNDSLARVRSMFLFSCFTGLRYSDSVNLKKSDIHQGPDGRYFMRVNQQKTDERIDNPMIQRAVSIYQHFDDKYPNSDYVLPRISNQKLNTYLKVIADLTGIRKKLTHHVARHTYATLMYEVTGDLKAVSHFLGHRNLNTTQIYARMTPQRMEVVIDRFGDSLG